MQNKVTFLLSSLFFLINFVNAEESKKETTQILHQDKVISIDQFDKNFNEIFVSLSRNIDLKDTKKEEIFFGEYTDYTKDYNLADTAVGGVFIGAWEGFKTGAKNFSGAGVVGATLGLISTGIGAVIGLGVGAHNQINKPYEYLLAYDITNNENEKSRVIVLYLTHESDEEKVRTIMDQELNKRINI